MNSAALNRRAGDRLADDIESLAAHAAAVTADVLGARVDGAAELLKAARHRSFVFRLSLRGGPRRTAIAKLCPAETAERELLVYGQVLPTLPVSAPTLFGARDHGDTWSWLVLEDAGDLEWSPSSAEHRALASEWFGAAHLAAADRAGGVPLPDRGAAYYREALRDAVYVAGEATTRNPALQPEAAAVLETFVALCATLRSSWSTVDAALAPFPPTFTLPGFCRKNARVRQKASAIELLPIDFENAGWGPPAADVQHVDVARYWRIVSPSWGVGREEVNLLSAVGRALVSLKSVPGERSTLLSPWPEQTVRKVAYYAESVERALKALGMPAA